MECVKHPRWENDIDVVKLAFLFIIVKICSQLDWIENWLLLTSRWLILENMINILRV